MNLELKKKLIQISLKKKKPELVLKNANVINVLSGEIHRSDVAIDSGYIIGLGNYEGITEKDMTGKYVCSGFVEAHFHTEGSMVTIERLVGEVLPYGTTTLFTDPHEIANVKGLEGLDYIFKSSENIPANVYIMLPSCVPSSNFETSGAVLNHKELEKIYNHERVMGLGEVMDYPALFDSNDDLLRKIELFKEKGTVDGHAPLMRREQVQAYRVAGVETDHESVEYEEALEKIRCGMHVLVREGTTAKNLVSIMTGIIKNNIDTSTLAFCTDDKSILKIREEGHINHNIKMAIDLGLDPIKAIAMATINPCRIYGLKDLGAVAPGYRADIVILDDLRSVKVNSVYKDGKLVSQSNESIKFEQYSCSESLRNTVNIKPLTKEDLAYKTDSEAIVIDLVPDQILTIRKAETVNVEYGYFLADNIYSKAAVIERHNATGNIGLGIIKGYGIKNAAIATTVSHDSHNLAIVGDNDEDMLLAAEELKRCGGGYTIVSKGKVLKTIELPIAGLITDDYSVDVDKSLEEFTDIAHNLGVPKDINPLIQLSYLALPVIPDIRLTDLGLFDVNEMRFI